MTKPDANSHEGVVADVAELLLERIHSGQIPIGMWLRQDALARDFAVSRTPIRNALGKLAEMGLVELIPYRGARVRGPSAREIREGYEVRGELEGFAAERAADLISGQQLERLREAERLFGNAVESLLQRPAGAEAPESAAATDDWVTANDQFHQVVQEAAANHSLREVIASLHRRFPRNLTWSVLGTDVRLLQENVAQHRAILAAIEERQPAEARRLMTEHIRRSGELIAMRMGDE